MQISWKWVWVLAGVSVCLALWLTPDTMQYSTTSQFKIIDKGQENYKLWILGYNPQEEQKKEIRLFIEDRSIWNLISEDGIYIITYTYKEGEEPVFLEIAPY